VLGKTSRSRRARVVLPLDEAPLMPTRIAFLSSMLKQIQNARVRGVCLMRPGGDDMLCAGRCFSHLSLEAEGIGLVSALSERRWTLSLTHFARCRDVASGQVDDGLVRLA
jgi:hypothetical protein